jgi:glyoxylase-like metal-dependent hydrolase (beta-lactamase superfamily II)
MSWPLQVGQAEVRRVEELTARLPMAMFGAAAGLDADGTWEMVVQSFIVVADDRVIVVDPCVGNGRDLPHFPLFDQLDTPFIERFAATGIRPDEVDGVFCTHLHSDHCGWNTTLRGGRYVPTFPKARYYMAEREVARWDSRGPVYRSVPANDGVFEASVLPVLEAGLADLIGDGTEISASLTARSAPGHTAGHTALQLRSAGAEAWFTGDAFHHPLELLHPETDAGTCEDFAATAATRKRLIDHLVATGAMIIPAHFAAPHAGFLRCEADGGLRFDALSAV